MTFDLLLWLSLAIDEPGSRLPVTYRVDRPLVPPSAPRELGGLAMPLDPPPHFPFGSPGSSVETNHVIQNGCRTVGRQAHTGCRR